MTDWVATCTEDGCTFSETAPRHYDAVEQAVEHRVKNQGPDARHKCDITQP